RPTVSPPSETSSRAMTCLANATGWRKLADATSGPSRIWLGVIAAAASVAIAAIHGESRRDLHARWSYVQAWSKPSSSARRHLGPPSDQRVSGRMIAPNFTQALCRFGASVSGIGEEPPFLPLRGTH